MKTLTRLAVVALALATAACQKNDAAENVTSGNAVSPAAAYAGKDWSQTVVRTAEGGFRMGNPDAPVKLIEYASLTCPHCRDFTKAGAEPLRENYVKTGDVSWEYRNFVLNPLDVAATIVVRCQGEGPYFKLLEQAYAKQEEWVGQFNKVDQKTLDALGTKPQLEQFRELIRLSGLEDFFRARGVPSTKIDACIADKAGMDELLKLRDYATSVDKVDGTPNFILNGTKLDNVYDWAGLETKLREVVR